MQPMVVRSTLLCQALETATTLFLLSYLASLYFWPPFVESGIHVKGVMEMESYIVTVASLFKGTI